MVNVIEQDEDDGFPWAKQRQKKLDRIREMTYEMCEANDWADRDERFTVIDALLDERERLIGNTLGHVARKYEDTIDKLLARITQLERPKKRPK